MEFLPFNGEIVYNYHYTIFAERKDCERNIPEYEGNSPNDYPETIVNLPSLDGIMIGGSHND